MISISKFEISVGLVADTSKIGAFIDSEIVLAKFLVFSVLEKNTTHTLINKCKRL